MAMEVKDFAEREIKNVNYYEGYNERRLSMSTVALTDVEETDGLTTHDDDDEYEDEVSTPKKRKKVPKKTSRRVTRSESIGINSPSRGSSVRSRRR